MEICLCRECGRSWLGGWFWLMIVTLLFSNRYEPCDQLGSQFCSNVCDDGAELEESLYFAVPDSLDFSGGSVAVAYPGASQMTYFGLYQSESRQSTDNLLLSRRHCLISTIVHVYSYITDFSIRAGQQTALLLRLIYIKDRKA